MPQYYQTPVDPLQAYIQAQQELQAAAIEAQKAAQAKQQQNSLMNTGLLIGGNKVMDSVIGGGSSAVASSIGNGATSLIPSAPSLSSGAAESLASSMGPYLPGQAPITPATAAQGVGAVPYLGAAGAALGAKGVFDATQMNDKKKAAMAGGLSGAGMGAGLAAAAPLVGLGPLGWGAMGLMALGGGGLGAGLGAAFAHKTTKEIQAERLAEAAKKNYTGFKETMDADLASAGPNEGGIVSNSAAPDFIGYDSEGRWTNNKFASSRNEADLRPDDIMRQLDLFNTFGDDWMGKFTDDQRRAISQGLLDDGLIQEKKGGIYVTDDAAARQVATDIISGARQVTPFKAEPPPPGAQGQQPQSSGSADFEGMLSSAIGGIKAQADQAVKDSKKQSLLRMAAEPINIPKSTSGVIKTGVQSLDDILGGVLG